MARIAPLVPDYDGSEETERGERPLRGVRRRRRWIQPGSGSGSEDPPATPVITFGEDGQWFDQDFAENMDQTSTPDAGDYVLNGTASTVASLAWQSATKLRGTLATHSAMGTDYETITVDYTPGVNPVRSVGEVDLEAFSGEAVANNSKQGPLCQQETLWAGATWNVPADLYDTTVTVEGWPAGQGGTVAGAAGKGGGYGRKELTVTPGGTVVVTIGAAGTAGGGNGGDIDVGSGAMILPGGNSATSPVADEYRAGGEPSGTPGSNTTGGASSGSDTAAALGVPGGPNGAPGVTGNLDPRIPGGGGSSTAAAAKPGAIGIVRITCWRYPPLTGPYSVFESELRDETALTTRPLDAADELHEDGDVIVVKTATHTAPAASVIDGSITEKLEQANATVGCFASAYARDATGNDTITITGSATMGAYHVSRLRRTAAGAAGVEASGATGSASTMNAGTHTPAAGGNTMRVVYYFGVFAVTSNNADGPTSHPVDYLGVLTPQRGDSSNTTGLISGKKSEAALSYTPGAPTSNTEHWSAGIVSVR